ncbi:hypothetical protein L596_003536 [Steinernema carpocapsae]|uniref:Uncharacterized protein n=1 Tax=Steinernema carpocapsae TaxID=34508 RepID=A0A4U8UUI1_STECR|nr:hypothetical protein L596_003536 [Steinernema carpocapsae]
MFPTLLCVVYLLSALTLGSSDEFDPVFYSHSYAQPSRNVYRYTSSSSSASSGNPSRSFAYSSSDPYSSFFSSNSPYSSFSSSSGHPYSSFYHVSSSSSSDRPHGASSYYGSSYSNQCSYEGDTVTENGRSRPMTEREKQTVRSYEREMMNYNMRSMSAMTEVNLRFMKQIEDGYFPAMFPYQNYSPMPKAPCFCSSCRKTGF